MKADTTASATSNLPIPLAPLVGREQEVASVGALLAQEGARLVTLTGPGGVGKTRLALRVAADAVAAFPDGVWFVPLASVADPDLVVPSVAHALGVRETGDQSVVDRLRAFLRGKRLLLVLDNLEQVVEAAPAVADLLAAGPGLTALVTSRVRLRISGEREYPVPPLAVPESDRPLPFDRLAESGAVRLFVERAQGVAPDFALTPQNAALIAEICRRLDGLPLAIELAAARTKVLPPAALLARLERRLPLLTDGSRDLPVRQQTLRDAIAWSYDLLSPAERSAFRRLAVFVRGFTLTAAEAVCGDSVLPLSPVQAIGALIDASLLRGLGEIGANPRFDMLDTIREYAAEQLDAGGEAAEARGRHAAWYLDWAEEAWSALATRPKQPTSLAAVEAEHDNLRAALVFLEQTGDRPGLTRLAGALAPFWILHSHRREGERWLRRATEEGSDAPAPLKARALTGLGLLLLQSEGSDAGGVLARGLELGRASGDAWSTALALHGSASLALGRGEYARAADLWRQALPLLQRLPDAPSRVALVRHHLGLVAYGENDPEGAAALIAEAIALYREQGDAWGVASSLTALGLIEGERGRLQPGASALTEALALWTSLGMREGLAAWLAATATLAASNERPDLAVELFGAEHALRAELGARQALPERARHERALASLRRQLGEEGFAAAWNRGLALATDDAVERARTTLTSPPQPAAPRASDPSRAGLTPRELEVLRLLAAGHSNQVIADTLSISLPTVKVHITHIFAKLGVDSRVAAAAYAHRHGIG